MDCKQKDGMTGMVAGIIKEMESKGGYLEKYPFFERQPMELFEKWFVVLVSPFAKKLWLHNFDLF